MISKNDQTRCLESLLNSQEFSGSKIYNSYLNYLVEAKNAGKELKETTIAFEFFGKDASFNPSEDTIVRSHTYQLRKKLESYYHEEERTISADWLFQRVTMTSNSFMYQMR